MILEILRRIRYYFNTTISLPGMDCSVKVYIEKPNEKDCFHHATCWIPGYVWEDVEGLSEAELARYLDVLKSTVQQKGFA